MSKKNTLAATGTLLLLAAVTHFVRSVLEWDLVFNGYAIPLWISYIVTFVAGFLGFRAIQWSQRVF